MLLPRNFTFLFLISIVFVSNSCNLTAQEISLNSYYNYHPEVDYKVDSIFNALPLRDKVAQMIVTSVGKNGKEYREVERLIRNRSVGGVIVMGGEKNAHKQAVANLNDLAAVHRNVPLLFSMDAEPSLLKGRVKGAQLVGETNDIKTIEQSDSITKIINRELHDIGIHHNYAPVLDISANNAAIKKRSYGNDPATVTNLANSFISKSQQEGIIATAKHFPGHGLVTGDTHHQSVYIDGELQELSNYPPVIANNVLSIMVAHIVVKNNPHYNTNGLPSTLSRNIVTDLLRNQLGFKGLIITDALNVMKAVTIFEDAPLMASKAGCDIILMPQDEEAVIASILKEMSVNPDYQAQVMESVKRMLRLKVCAGLYK